MIVGRLMREAVGSMKSLANYGAVPISVCGMCGLSVYAGFIHYCRNDKFNFSVDVESTG